MKINHIKAYDALRNEGKLPRKIKKSILGVRMPKNKIRLKIKVLKSKEGWEKSADFFCPDCGCNTTRSTGNMVNYPDVYVKEFCARCGKLVAMADNSPWHHCLECDNNNID